MCQPPANSILLITGSSLRAEEMDRPLAYYLRDRIRERCEPVPRSIYVISDFRYLYEKKFDALPAISIGGPAVNAVTNKWLGCVPVALTVEEEFFIQLSECPAESPRAAIWGVDHETTKLAVATFLDQYLCPFLAAAPVPATEES